MLVMQISLASSWFLCSLRCNLQFKVQLFLYFCSFSWVGMHFGVPQHIDKQNICFFYSCLPCSRSAIMPFSSAEGGILQPYYSQSQSEVSISKMIPSTRYNLGSYNSSRCWMLWQYLIKLQSNIFQVWNPNTEFASESVAVYFTWVFMSHLRKINFLPTWPNWHPKAFHVLLQAKIVDPFISIVQTTNT